jgi:hypothetical protein
MAGADFVHKGQSLIDESDLKKIRERKGPEAKRLYDGCDSTEDLRAWDWQNKYSPKFSVPIQPASFRRDESTHVVIMASFIRMSFTRH